MKLLIEILLKHIEIVSRDSYCIVLRTAVYSGSLFDFQNKAELKFFFTATMLRRPDTPGSGSGHTFTTATLPNT